MNEKIVKKIKGKEVKNVEISISKYARENGIAWATAKKILFGNNKRKKRSFNGHYIIENFKNIIDMKLEKYDCSGSSLYYLIKKAGYDGSLSTIEKYVRKKKKEFLKKATIRVETTPGLQAQVDWKERLTLISKNKTPYTINIFLYILSYSKFKYIELTVDRTQPTLFTGLVNAFKYCGNLIPDEIWFDNMKTVVDSHDVNSGTVTFNSKFLEFSKNAGFLPIACKPYRPCTKGLVENLAKVMDRLKAFNEEFEDYDDLKKIVETLNVDLNNEISQSTYQKPSEMYLTKEKEYMTPINVEQFNYKPNRQVRIVEKDSMINYDKRKYSISVNYIGELVEIEQIVDQLHIYYNGNEIACHLISDSRLNYTEEHLKEILPSVFPGASQEQIEEMAKHRLKHLDLKHKEKKDDKL